MTKKERMDAASRKAPWLADVDWEGCTNVAQLYVHPCFISLFFVVFLNIETLIRLG